MDDVGQDPGIDIARADAVDLRAGQDPGVGEDALEEMPAVYSHSPPTVPPTVRGVDPGPGGINDAGSQGRVKPTVTGLIPGIFLK